MTSMQLIRPAVFVFPDLPWMWVKLTVLAECLGMGPRNLLIEFLDHGTLPVVVSDSLHAVTFSDIYHFVVQANLEEAYVPKGWADAVLKHPKAYIWRKSEDGNKLYELRSGKYCHVHFAMLTLVCERAVEIPTISFRDLVSRVWVEDQKLLSKHLSTQPDPSTELP